MLVCEDAIGYRMLIRRWLEDAGVEVVGEAPTWPEAERLAEELQPDAVVADLWMPTLDVDALTRLRTRAPSAAIVNAKAASGLGLSDLVWSFAPPPKEPPTRLVEVPATTPESVALAKELKRRGFRFVGPTTAYAAMQACGLVNDHLAGCVARDGS